MSPYERARELVDAAHAADPRKSADGRPLELAYADRMEGWVARLDPDASALLRLAARCQHLERWQVPRDSFPGGRAGYLAWRKSLYGKQAARARALLSEAGVSGEEADRAAAWVAKERLKADPGAQALEDAACIDFLDTELAAFAAQHDGYPREKFIEILRKSWRKMSPRARELALGLRMAPELAALLREATEL